MQRHVLNVYKWWVCDPAGRRRGPAGCDTLSLRHPAEPTDVSQPTIENEWLSVSRIFTATGLFYSLTAPKTWWRNKKEINIKHTYSRSGSRNRKEEALWCQWSLIKFLRRRGWACGWRRNVCMVFALCPPQATVPPEALYISLTLLPVTLWLWSYPQPAPTSDPCTKRASIMFLSLCFCSRGYLWGQTWPH